MNILVSVFLCCTHCGHLLSSSSQPSAARTVTGWTLQSWMWQRQRMVSAVVRWRQKQKTQTQRWIMHFEVLATFVIKIPSVLWDLAERRWCVFDEQLQWFRLHTWAERAQRGISVSVRMCFHYIRVCVTQGLIVITSAFCRVIVHLSDWSRSAH